MTITIPLPGGPTKRRIVEMAYGKLTMTGYEFGRTPEEINDALSELNGMMLEWPFSGLGFVQPSYGIGDADELSGIPDDCLAAAATQLSLRLAPNKGRSLSPAANKLIATSLAFLHSRVASVISQPLQANTPRGMGSDRGAAWRDPFINEALTFSTTGDTTSGSNRLTNCLATDGILPGFSVSGSGIPSGTTVVFVSGPTVTVSANATATASGVDLTFQGS